MSVSNSTGSPWTSSSHSSLPLLHCTSLCGLHHHYHLDQCSSPWTSIPLGNIWPSHGLSGHSETSSCYGNHIPSDHDPLSHNENSLSPVFHLGVCHFSPSPWNCLRPWNLDSFWTLALGAWSPGEICISLTFLHAALWNSAICRKARSRLPSGTDRIFSWMCSSLIPAINLSRNARVTNCPKLQGPASRRNSATE